MEYKEFGGVWRSMDGGVIGEFLVVWGVGTSMGEYGWSEKVWKEIWRMCWGVEKCGRRKGEMWGRWGKCGGRCGEKWVEDPISPTSPLTSPTHFPTSTPHLFSHLLPHFSIPTPTFSHSFHIPPYLTQLPKLLKIPPLSHHPYSSKLPQILYNLLFFPMLLPRRTTIVTSSFTPHQNFSLFSFIVKLIQQSSTLETPCSLNFIKKKIKNKNIKWQHSV